MDRLALRHKLGDDCNLDSVDVSSIPIVEHCDDNRANFNRPNLLIIKYPIDILFYLPCTSTATHGECTVQLNIRSKK